MKSGFYLRKLSPLNYERRYIIGLLPNGNALSICYHGTGANYVVIPMNELKEWRENDD